MKCVAKQAEQERNRASHAEIQLRLAEKMVMHAETSLEKCESVTKVSKTLGIKNKAESREEHGNLQD